MCIRDREEVGPGALAQQVDDLSSARNVAARGPAERLAEGAGENVYSVGDPAQFGGAAPALAEKADGVRVVDEHERVIALGKVADLFEGCDVAVHREDAVGDDHPEPRVCGLEETLFELDDVAIRIAQPASLRQPDSCLLYTSAYPAVGSTRM